MKSSTVSSKVSQYNVVYNYIKRKKIIIRDTCFHFVPLFCFRVKDIQIYKFTAKTFCIYEYT